MALIQWKQINPQLLGNGQLTGSLQVSGSIVLNGVDLTNLSNISNASINELNSKIASINASTGSHLTDLTESHLEELKNVNASGILNGQVLVYDSSTDQYIPHTLTDGTITSISNGNGLLGGGSEGNVVLTLDTGSTHFRSGVNSLINTDFSNLTNVPTLISGSNQVSLSGVDGFSVYSGSVASTIQQERQRIDSILSASSIDKDSFAEIISFIEGANLQDLQNLTAFITSSNNRDEALEQSVNLLSSSIASDIATISSSLLSGVLPGSGLQSNNDPGTVTLSVDTGSQHFITGVIDLNIFQQIGSYYSTTNDLQVTGSLTLRKDESGDALSVFSGSVKTFGITDQGVLKFASQSTTPTAVAGGMYFDSNFNLFIGQE